MTMRSVAATRPVVRPAQSVNTGVFYCRPSVRMARPAVTDLRPALYGRCVETSQCGGALRGRSDRPDVMIDSGAHLTRREWFTAAATLMAVFARPLPGGCQDSRTRLILLGT